MQAGTMTSDSAPSGLAKQNWLTGRPGMFVALLWGFAEGTVFFVIPDVFLSYVAVLNWRATWKHILAAIAGALLAGALLFHWSRAEPEVARSVISRVPFVTPTMIAKVDEGFRTHGLWAIFLGSISGIPYKIYAVEAPRFVPGAEFLLATPPARFGRFFLSWCVFGAAAAWLRKRYSLQTCQLTRIHAAIWLVNYASYWGWIVFR
jgi:membrane protein YqaA with SNARE-associated domain